MPTITEGQLKFTFPKDWEADKFDEWGFYRNQFLRLGEAEMFCNNDACQRVVHCQACGSKRIAGTKGTDILAVAPDSQCWHIEIKDYRTTLVNGFRFLADEVALKVRDTLACLTVARYHATEPAEQELARKAIRCQHMRIVLHLEQNATGKSIHDLRTRRANVVQRLKQLVKAIDPHPQVVSMDDTGSLPWTVNEV